MRGDISYADYLDAVSKQRERDRDRFQGIDSHPESEAYDSRTGESVNRASLHIEIDEDGWPQVVLARGKRSEWAILRRAALSLNIWRNSGCHGDAHDFVRKEEKNVRAWRAEEELRRQEYREAHPFECECPGRPRFKTVRGLKQHRAKSQWCQIQEVER